MQRQHVLLRLALDRDQAHRRPSDRFADRLGVARIVLVGLHVRPHKSCTHQPDLVTALANLAGPMVSAATRLHRHHAWLQLHYNGEELLAAELAPLSDRPRLRRELETDSLPSRFP